MIVLPSSRCPTAPCLAQTRKWRFWNRMKESLRPESLLLFSTLRRIALISLVACASSASWKSVSCVVSQKLVTVQKDSSALKQSIPSGSRTHVYVFFGSGSFFCGIVTLLLPSLWSFDPGQTEMCADETFGAVFWKVKPKYQI